MLGLWPGQGPRPGPGSESGLGPGPEQGLGKRPVIKQDLGPKPG